MKKLLLCVSIVFIYAFGITQTARYQPCIIAFYNLENLYDTIDNPMVNDDEFTPNGAKKYGTEIFRDKLGKLARVIAGIGTQFTEHGAALLGVAEIENDTVLQFLVQHPLLQKRNYHLVHGESKDQRGVDVALLYQPAYFKPITAQKMPVSLPGNSKEALFTRDILYVKGILGSDTIHVFVNHWPSRRGGQKRSEPARMSAAMTLRRQINLLLQEDSLANIVVMGDFNDDPVDRSITKALGTSGNEAQLLPGHLFNPWVRPYQMGIGTLANQDSWGLFDQIMLSPSWLNRQKTGYHYYQPFIYHQPFMEEDRGRYRHYPMRTWSGNEYRGGYSDHFPVFLVFLKLVN